MIRVHQNCVEIFGDAFCCNHAKEFGFLPLFVRLFLERLPESISKMEQCQNRMSIDHAGT